MVEVFLIYLPHNPVTLKEHRLSFKSCNNFSNYYATCIGEVLFKCLL